MAVEPWYPRDWLSSEARAVLTPAGRSAYRDLLDASWLAGGRLRDDDRVLQGLSGLDRGEWEAVREDVLRYFPVVEPGCRANPRQVAEYAKADAYREACRAGGKATAAKRWGGDSQAIAEQVRPNRTPTPTPSPSPTPTPTQNSTTEEEPQACPQERTSGSGTTRLLPSFVTIWNEVMDGSPLPLVRAWTPARDRLLKARLAEEGDLSLWRVAMERLRDSPHHRGQNDRGWVADVEFLLRASQAPKWLDAARSDARPVVPMNGKAGPNQIMAWAQELEAKRASAGGVS